MLVLYLTKSPIDAGLAVFVSTVPGILIYMPAGALVDRWDPRRTILVSEFGRGLAISVVVSLLALHMSNIPIIVGAAIVEETLEIFVVLAERRYLGTLVEPRLTSSALMRTEARSHLVAFAGRPLGALLFEFLPILPFLLDVLSFIISVRVLFSVKGEIQVRNADSLKPRLGREILNGIALSRSDRFVYAAIWLTAFMTLISQALIMIFLVDVQKLHLSSVIMGAVLACSGLGGALGALIGSRIVVLGRFSRIKIQVYIWCAGLLALALFGRLCQFPLMGIIMFIFGFAGAMGNIEFDTHLLRKVPLTMLARVTSIDRLSSFAACAIGPAVGGLLVGKLGSQEAIWGLFGTTVAVAGSGVILRFWKMAIGFWVQVTAFPRKRSVAKELARTKAKDLAKEKQRARDLELARARAKDTELAGTRVKQIAS